MAATALPSKADIKIRTRELVAQFQAGDESAFTALYRLHFATVNHYIAHKFFHGEKDKAQDITQEAFISAQKALDKFRSETEFASWVIGIARNIAMEDYRRNKVHLYSDNAVEVSDLEDVMAEDPCDIVQRQIAAERLNEYFRRRVLDSDEVAQGLRYLWRMQTEDLPYQAIAEETGTPINTIRSHIFRARAALRDEMRPYFG